MEKRIITTDVMEEDLRTEGNLRPQFLSDYIGQEKAKSNLKIYIEAAKQRGDAWTMCFSTVLRVLEKPLLRELLPMRWAYI